MPRIVNPDTQKPLVAFTGAGGRLGQAWLEYSSEQTIGLYRGNPAYDARAYGQIGNFDISDRDHVLRIVAELGDLGVRTLINSAGKVGVDPLEPERGQHDGPAFQANVNGAAHLADACRENGIRLMQVSTKCVIPHDIAESYPEILVPDNDLNDVGNVTTWYGITNAMGEQEVFRRYPEGSAIVRLDNIHGPSSALTGGTAKLLQDKKSFSRVNDMYSGHFTDKTAVEGLENIERRIHNRPSMSSKAIDLYHLGARDAMTPYQIALTFADRFGADPELVTPMTQEEYMATKPSIVRRPLRALLEFTRYEHEFRQLPTVEQELDRYLSLYIRD